MSVLLARDQLPQDQVDGGLDLLGDHALVRDGDLDFVDLLDLSDSECALGVGVTEELELIHLVQDVILVDLRVAPVYFQSSL